MPPPKNPAPLLCPRCFLAGWWGELSTGTQPRRLVMDGRVITSARVRSYRCTRCGAGWQTVERITTDSFKRGLRIRGRGDSSADATRRQRRRKGEAPRWTAEDPGGEPEPG